MSLSLPKIIIDRIISEARKRGISPEELVSEILLNELFRDPNDRLRVYIELHKKYVREAEKKIEEKDFIQASEKIWGAAASIVKAAALVLLRKRLSSHGEMWEFVSKLADKYNDNELRHLWRTAISMHINFYENWAPPEEVKKSLDDIKKFAEKIMKYANLRL